MSARPETLQTSPVVHEAAIEVEIRPGRRISVSVSEGRGAETTIFLCHGAGGNKNQWRHQWVALVAAGLRVVAWDLPGHGLSPRPRDPDAYDGDELVADFRAILARWGGARNILAAHSYGTSLALCLVQGDDRPRSIGGLMLLGPPSPQADLRATPLGRWPLWLLILIRPLMSRVFRRSAWGPDADPALIAFEAAATKGNRLFVMKALFAGAARPDPARLAGFDLPVILLAGDEDGLTPVAGARAWANLVGPARLEVFPACGHQIMLERPEATTRHLFALIAGESPSGTV